MDPLSMPAGAPLSPQPAFGPCTWVKPNQYEGPTKGGSSVRAAAQAAAR